MDFHIQSFWQGTNLFRISTLESKHQNSQTPVGENNGDHKPYIKTQKSIVPVHEMFYES